MVHNWLAERSGSVMAGQACPIRNRTAIPPFTAPGWLGHGPVLGKTLIQFPQLTASNHENPLIVLSVSKDYQVQEYLGRLSP